VRRRFAQFAWTVLGFNVLVILWGALVRASKSGEGCGDHWPLCNGTVIPHAAQIATIIEFTHRASIPVATVLVVAMAAWAFRAFRGELAWKGSMASLIFLVTEALLGAGLVLFKYTGADVSVGRVLYLSAHLINTHMLLAAIALTAWWGSGRRGIEWTGSTARLLQIAIGVALAIGVTGAVTALSDTVFPATSLRGGLAADLSVASPMLVRLRILHPALAIVGGFFTLIVAVRVTRAPGLARAVRGLVILQVCAGSMNLILLAPVWMQLVHLLLADLLWIALVLFMAETLEAAPARAPEVVHQY
jgi:heme A synthase